MFLHIEKNETVLKKDIIGIFDIEKASLSEYTKNFFKEAQSSFSVVNICNDLPKAFVVTDDKICSKIYITGNSVNSIINR